MVRAMYLYNLAFAALSTGVAGEFDPQELDGVMLLQSRGEITADLGLPADDEAEWIPEDEIYKRYTFEQVDTMIQSGEIVTKTKTLYRVVAKSQGCEGVDCATAPQVAGSPKPVSGNSTEGASANSTDGASANSTDGASANSTDGAYAESALRTDQAPNVGLPSAETTTSSPAATTTSTPAATTTAAPASTTKPECAELGTCAIYEDPHIRVFDGVQISLLGSLGLHKHKLTKEDAGDMWLVRSPDISIQARYLPDPDLPEENLFIRSLAVGGPFLDGYKFIIGSVDDGILWKGEDILETQPSEFYFTVSNGTVYAKRHAESHLVQDMTQTNPGVDVELPLGVKLTVNRLRKHVNVHITMPAAPGGQQGLCGNFNCNAADDALHMILQDRNPRVLQEDSLF